MRMGINMLLALLFGLTALSCERGETTGEVQEKSEEIEEADQAAPETVAADFARFQTQIVRFRNEVGRFECICSPERLGFESTEECKDGIGLWDDEALDSYEECITDVLAGADEPPLGSVKLIECLREASEPVSDCFANLDIEEGDLCTEQGSAQHEQCTELLDSGMEECMEHIQETTGQDDFFAEHEDWSLSVYDESNACLEAALE